MGQCFPVIIFYSKAICFYAKGEARATAKFALIVAKGDSKIRDFFFFFF